MFESNIGKVGTMGALGTLLSLGKTAWDFVNFLIEWTWLALLFIGASIAIGLWVRWMDRDLNIH